MFFDNSITTRYLQTNNKRKFEYSLGKDKAVVNN